jgi:hypothetical protein
MNPLRNDRYLATSLQIPFSISDLHPTFCEVATISLVANWKVEGRFGEASAFAQLTEVRGIWQLLAIVEQNKILEFLAFVSLIEVGCFQILERPRRSHCETGRWRNQ